MMDSVQLPFTLWWRNNTLGQNVTTYHVKIGLHLSFVLPFFGILIAGELAIFLFKHYRTYLKEGRTDAPLHVKNEHLMYRWNDSFSSLCSGMVQQLVAKIFCKYFGLVTYCFVYHYWRVMTVPVTGVLSLWWWYCFFLQDFDYYWYHRFTHECNLGWATHAPHHSSEEYNLTTALRQGIFQQFLGKTFALPVAMLGVHPAMYAVQGEINLLYQYWLHTKVIGKLPWIIEYIFNTPSHHRVHHGRNPKYIDKNYGGTLIIFDRMFGTFEQESEEVVYGIVHPLQTFSPIHTQIHHFVDMWNECKKMPTLWKKIAVYVRAPGYNVSDGTWFPLPDAPPVAKTRKYDITIPSHVTYFAFIHFIFIFLSAVILNTTKQPSYFHSLAQFANLSFGSYTISLLYDGYFSQFCYYERIRYLLNWPILLLNMFNATRFVVGYINIHISGVLLKHQKTSNGLAVFYLISALYVQTILSRYKDVPRPPVQDWEQERKLKEE